MSDPKDSKENELDLSAFDNIDDLNLDSPNSEASEISDFADTMDHDDGDLDLDFSGFGDEAPTQLADDSISVTDDFDSVSGIEEDALDDFANEPFESTAEQDVDLTADVLDSFSTPADDIEETMQLRTETMTPPAMDDLADFAPEPEAAEPEVTDAKGKKKKEKKVKEPKAKKEKAPKEPKVKKEKKPKEPKAPKPKKEKKEKPPRDPNAPGLDTEDMFALGSAALLAVMVLVAFVFSLSSIVFAVLVLIFGVVIVAVPLLLYKFKHERSLYDVMLGIAAAAFTVSALLVLAEWSRYW